MSNMNLTQGNMDALLKMAGKKLGQEPESIKNNLEQGDLNRVIGGLDPKIQKKISDLANNPDAVTALMQNSSVQNLLSGLMGKK